MTPYIHLTNVDLITIGTIGPPGKRVFYLQGKQADKLVTLIIEKFQAMAIAENIDLILRQIAEDYDRDTPGPDLSTLDLDMIEPIQPLFRAGQIGLGYNDQEDLLTLVIAEMLPEEGTEEARIVQFSAQRPLMAALAEHTEIVAAAGRPICGNCGQPIDPDGHFCPDSNGHRKPVSWA
nr:DUF3090 domain-containing protein [Anaerolineae bacterium]